MSNEQSRLLLIKYFRNGCLSRTDKLLSIFFSTTQINENAKKISASFKAIEDLEDNFNTITSEIENYSGKNIHAKKISDFLKTEISDSLIGAYVHGSVATSEEVAYSDFDGFVILKNKVLMDSKKCQPSGKRLLRCRLMNKLQDG